MNARCVADWKAPKARPIPAWGVAPCLSKGDGRGLKARSIIISIPHISLVRFDAVFLEKGTKFFLKVLFSMMRFLGIDVLKQCIKISRANGESAITSLPSKLGKVGGLSLEPGRGRGFRLFNNFSNRFGTRDTDRKMDVVGGSAGTVAFASRVADERGEVCVERGADGFAEERLAVFRGEDYVDEEEGQGLRHGGDYRSGLQPSSSLGLRTWGVAPCWYRTAPLALSSCRIAGFLATVGIFVFLVSGCKSAPGKITEPWATTRQPAPTYPARPTVKPPAFKVFHVHDDVVTLVTKPDATDDEVEAILWQLRDTAHAKTLDSLKVSQKLVDDRKPLVWFHIYRGTKCAAEKYADGALPCGNRYNGAGDYTYGGYANRELDRGVIRDGDKETELWDSEKVYVKGN
jgi:hypothetical protein